MIQLRRVVLDVLKPHAPDVVDFANALARCGVGLEVHVRVAEMDEKTETLEVIVAGESIEMDRLRAAISEVGASLHSIDEVAVRSASDGE